MCSVNLTVDLLGTWPNPSRPFVTYYDLRAGERIELSGTTARNWVMKAANLLVDEADAEVGTRVSLTMPSHWMRMVWLLGIWAVGATVVDRDPDVVIAGPDLDFGAPEPSQRWATALHPLGLPFDELPAGVLDLGRALPGQPDAFVALDAPSSGDPAVDLSGLRRTYGELGDLGSTTADRHAFMPADLPIDIQRLVSVCHGGGSFVLVTGADPDQLRKVATQEHAVLP